MGRIGTWVLVVGIAGLAAAAALDAVRGGDDAPAAEPPQAEAVTTAQLDDPVSDRWRRLAARDLEAGGATGALVVAGASCRATEIELPGVEERELADPACRFTTSPGGRAAVGPSVVAPGGKLAARCDGDVTRLRDGTRLLAETRGCRPAWTPDGRLTLVRDGELVELRRCEGRWRCTELVLGRAQLARAFGRDPWSFETPIVREAAWLAEDAFALIVRDSVGRRDAIAVFRGGRLAGGPPYAYDRLTDLRASPGGSWAAARVDKRSLVTVDAEGSYVGSSLRSAHAVAWSPDERWTAMATGEGVYVFESGGRANRFVLLRVEAVDLVWR